MSEGLLDAAVVLAGGKSARMGAEKSLLHAGGSTLIERTLATLARAFEKLAVSVGNGGPSPGLAAAIEEASRGAGRQIEVFQDREGDEGPLAAVASALEEIDGVQAFFMAVDMPEVSLPLARALWEDAAGPGRTGSIPRWARGLEPACAVYCKCLHPAMRKLLEGGTRSLHAAATLPGMGALDLTSARVLRRVFGDAPPDLEDIFRNLNTPGDHAEWLRRVGG